MKALELFAGAGGAALGMRQAGVEALACVEIDAAAVATLKAAGFPAVQADLKTWSWDGDRPDLLWSSFPCQVWSVAGTRDGAKDTERNGWPWTLRIIDEAKPAWVVLENVRGLTMHTEAECGNVNGCAGCYLHGEILASLRKRYASVQHVVLNAADYGVPQHRRRLIVVAGNRPIRWPEPTHAAPDKTLGLFGELLPWVTMGEALGLDAVIGGGSNPRQKNAAHERTLRDLTNEPSTTIAAQLGGGAGNAGPFVLDHSRNTDNNPNQERPTPSNSGSSQEIFSTNRPSKTVCAGSNRDNGIRIVTQPAPTVTATEVKGHSIEPTKKNRASDALFLATQRRRLTIAECAVLQDFPHDHPWQGNKDQQYRQAGNAVPPTLARVVVEAIARAAKESS